MSSSLGRVAAAAAAALCLLAPHVGHAFCRTTTIPVPATFNPTKGCFTDGLPLFWKNQCVSYSINEAASDKFTLAQVTPIINNAFTTWTTSTCDSGGTVGISASPTQNVTCAQVRYNQNGPNQNVIVFRDSNWPYSDPNNTLGLTTVTFNADNGEIYDADMEINASGKNLTITDPPPANGFDLLSVITHEAGHFLGLAHAQSATSTMYASYKPGTTSLRTLSADDVAGICSIYPDGKTRNVATSVDPSGHEASDACDATPRHGFGTTCDENPSPSEQKGCSVAEAEAPSSATLAVVVGAAGMVAARRRRRAVS